MDVRDNQEFEIDLRDILRILKKRLKLIVIVTLMATLISGVFSFFVFTPIYEGTTDMLVNKSDSDQASTYNLNDINIDLKLIETYKVIMKSPRILDLVIDEYHLNMTREQLASKLSISTVNNSKIMQIKVTDPSQAEAVRIANGIALTFQQEIVKIMNVDNVQILAKAKVVDGRAPVKPNKKLNVAIAFVLGLMLSAGAAFLLEYLDNTVRTEEDVEKLLGYPVLGAIATIEKDNSRARRVVSMTVSQRGEVHEG